MKKKLARAVPPPRNPFVVTAGLRKAGSHEKPLKAKRRDAKLAIKAELAGLDGRRERRDYGEGGNGPGGCSMFLKATLFSKACGLYPAYAA